MYASLPALLVAALASPCRALWPIPRSLEMGSTPLVLAPDFRIVGLRDSPADLSSAVARSLAYIRTDRMQRLVVGRAEADCALLQDAVQLPSLVLSIPEGEEVVSIVQEAVRPLRMRREEYVLHVPADGAPAMLAANSTLGLLRGLTTFEQLWYDLDGNATYTLEAPIIVSDSPAFPYRGFMLDTSRNFFPVTDIKRTLDAMSWTKMSQFHWHVTDSHSFPLQVPGFEEVAEKGSYAQDMIYTPADVQDVITYTAERGIDVLMDIDTPGHTAAIYESHPEHIACYLGSPWQTYANEPPAGQLRFASPSTTTFTTELFAAAARMTMSSLFSTGGDELNLECYTNDTATQEALAATNQTLEEALNTFTMSTHGALTKLGKTGVIKSDMVLDHNLTLPNDTVVIVWKSSADAVSIAAKGFQFVHQPSDYFYLDCGAGEWLGQDPLGNSWCDPFKTWQRTYTFDPFMNLSTSQHQLVLGGQQPLWTEQSEPENLDSIVWPRAASSAEVFWTGATLPGGLPRNVSSALPRLHDLRFRMVQRGVQAIPLQPLWCALRPGLCDLQS